MVAIVYQILRYFLSWHHRNIGFSIDHVLVNRLRDLFPGSGSSSGSVSLSWHDWHGVLSSIFQHLLQLQGDLGPQLLSSEGGVVSTQGQGALRGRPSHWPWQSSIDGPWRLRRSHVLRIPRVDMRTHSAVDDRRLGRNKIERRGEIYVGQTETKFERKEIEVVIETGNQESPNRKNLIKSHDWSGRLSGQLTRKVKRRVCKKIIPLWNMLARCQSSLRANY